MAQQIIVKENESGRRQLFDTRSEKFLDGGCINSADSEIDLIDLANNIVRKTHRTIVELATNWIYREWGYAESMMATAYLKINPDIRTKVMEKLKADKEEIAVKVDKKTIRKGKGRKVKDISTKNTKVSLDNPAYKPLQESKVVSEDIGRNSESTEIKRGRGRPKGSLNRPKDQISVPKVLQKRGRPAGSKNRPK